MIGQPNEKSEAILLKFISATSLLQEIADSQLWHRQKNALFHELGITLSMGRIQGLSATLVSSHLAGSRNKHFYSPLDGC